MSEPSFFMYEDGGSWYKTDKSLTREILNHITWRKPLSTKGKSFYPQWPKPEYKSQTKTAWRVDSDGERVVRWHWKVQEHKPRSHQGCKMVNGKQCGVRIPAMLRWDDKKQFWVLVEIDGKATEAEAKTLDRKLKN